MKKYIMLIIVCWSSIGFAKSMNYYLANPQLVERELAACPATQPTDISCDALKQIAIKIDSLIYELHSDRLAYGQNILSLQEIIAKQRVLQSHNEESSNLNENINNLNARLAVIRWLESPES